MKEPVLAPLTENNNLENNSEVDMETDDSASVSSVGNGASSTRVIEEVDDEGFFDKPAVSPSESSDGTSTPPPSSEDSENLTCTEDFLNSRPQFAT